MLMALVGLFILLAIALALKLAVDLSVTATLVLKAADTQVNNTSNFGETVTAGMSVYKKASDGLWYKAQCDGTAEESGTVGLGVALNGGAVGQPAVVAVGGTVTIGATVTVGIIYCVSATFGGICPSADLASTNKVSILGYGATATTISLDINATGIIKA